MAERSHPPGRSTACGAGGEEDPPPAVWILEKDSEMEMCVQEAGEGAHSVTEAAGDPAGGSGAAASFRAVLHDEARGLGILLLSVSDSHGRRENNLGVGGSSLQPKAIPREGCSCEPPAAHTPHERMHGSPERGI